MKTEQEWRKELGPERYRILREKGTERPGSGKLLHKKEKGEYLCGACGQVLFRSKDKYDSGTGWPSFSDAVRENVELKRDFSRLMIRTEVACKKCGSHLGHVFRDGPKPTGKRYCINSLALDFREK